jgi:hypothetical protein
MRNIQTIHLPAAYLFIHEGKTIKIIIIKNYSEIMGNKKFLSNRPCKIVILRIDYTMK